MKELFKEEFENSKVDKEIVASIQKKKEHKLIAQQRITKGHILWKFNPSTKHLSSDIKYKKSDLVINDFSNNSSDSFKISVDVEDGYIYFQKLNRKNAISYLNKNGYKL